MEHINKQLKEQFERECELLTSYPDWPQVIKNVNLVTNVEILRGYYLLADYFLETDREEKMLVGIKNVSLLESALGRQIVSFGGAYKWTQLESIAATLFFGLVKNHAFHDGNKRIALLMLIFFLYKNGRIVNSPINEFRELAVRTAANELYKYPDYKNFQKKYPDDTEIYFIQKFISKKTRTIDKNYYALTYREFDARLRRFNCKLDNPSGGFIDVVYKVKEKKLWGLMEKEVEQKFKIGFKSWKAQVGAKAVKEALKRCNLTADDGVDSKVFFQDTEPMNKLIEQFEGPLRRLKDQ